MDSHEQRCALRAAVYRGDGPAVVDLLRGAGAYDDALQLAGDGLIAALMQRVDGAPELARELVVALRERGWEGDDELADQVDALLGSGPAPMLRALPVDLEELAGILEGDPLTAGGRIDVRTGEVWPRAAIEYALETGEEDDDTADDPERWLPVHGEGSRDGYRDMELFIASVDALGVPSAWPSRSAAAACSAASRTSSHAGPASLSDGTHSPRNASAAERDHGSPRPGTARCPPTTAIPDTGSSPRHRPRAEARPGREGTFHNQPDDSRCASFGSDPGGEILRLGGWRCGSVAVTRRLPPALARLRWLR